MKIGTLSFLTDTTIYNFYHYHCTATNIISSVNWRPASSSGIAKEIKNEAIGSDSGEDSGSDTSRSTAPAAWITEIQQNELFRKVRQKIENWEKFSKFYAGEHPKVSHLETENPDDVL